MKIEVIEQESGGSWFVGLDDGQGNRPYASDLTDDEAAWIVFKAISSKSVNVPYVATEEAHKEYAAKHKWRDGHDKDLRKKENQSNG